MHYTNIGDISVAWNIATQNHRIEIDTITYHDGAGARVPAYRMRMDGSHVDIANARPGRILFGEADERPDLAQVREWFPALTPLWDRVRAEFWKAIAPLEFPTCPELIQRQNPVGQRG